MPTYKSGYELVNVWGRFSFNGKLPLKRIECTFKNPQYIEVCESILWPWVKNVYSSLENFILQEENCGPHRAIAVRKYMEQLNVPRMVWPPQSPDVAPIENAWGL